jgi:hypothetical protein
MKEPSHDCFHCDSRMVVEPTFPAGVRYVPGVGGFHCCDYPKSNDQLIKDYGLEDKISTTDHSEYYEGD